MESERPSDGFIWKPVVPWAVSGAVGHRAGDERFKREGTCVFLWLIHVGVWRKPAQYCKAIILQ